MMVVAISLNQWHTLVRATGIEEHLPQIERVFQADFRKEEDRYRARDAIAALDEAVVRGPHARRGAQGARRARRVLGSVPDVHAAARRRLARVGGEPGLRQRASIPGIGPLLTPTSPLRFADVFNDGARPRAPPRHPHRRGARGSARPRRRTRSGGSTTTASSRRRSRSVSERRRAASSRTPGSPPRRPTRSPARAPGSSRRASTPIPPGSTTAPCPPLWHWACFVPTVPTAELGPDGHPRRRPEMDAFPQRMWVGGRVRVTRPLELDVEATPRRVTSRRPR